MKFVTTGNKLFEGFFQKGVLENYFLFFIALRLIYFWKQTKVKKKSLKCKKYFWKCHETIGSAIFQAVRKILFIQTFQEISNLMFSEMMASEVFEAFPIACQTFVTFLCPLNTKKTYRQIYKPAFFLPQLTFFANIIIEQTLPTNYKISNALHLLKASSCMDICKFQSMNCWKITCFVANQINYYLCTEKVFFPSGNLCKMDLFVA